MYTLYFQQIKESPYFKYVANKSTFPDFMLGMTCDMWQMQSLWEKGYRVVVQPAEPLLVDSDIQMFYAKGYRGPDSKPVADFESDINAWTGLGDDEVPNTESAENAENTESAEYAKFVAYANGQEPDWCSADFGHGRHDKEPIPDKSAKSDEVAQNANNQSSPTPRIGPLPPQASLAPLIESGYRNDAWTFVTHTCFEPWTPEHGIVQTKEPPLPPEGSMLLPKFKTEYVNVPEFAIDSSNWQDRRIEQFIKDAETTKSLTAPDELSWWQKLKNWCKTDF